MSNRYALWKYLVIVVVLLVGSLYALPNLFGEDPSLQISASGRGVELDTGVTEQLVRALERANIPVKRTTLENNRLLVRFTNTDYQLEAAEIARAELGDEFTVALNLAPDTPSWLAAMGLQPMYMGLDLRGGVHFLMEVDMDAVVTQAEEGYAEQVRAMLRDARIRYTTVERGAAGGVEVRFADAATRDEAERLLDRELPDLQISAQGEGGSARIELAMTEQEIADKRRFALQQNMTTLRNRVNELGVAEPIVQQQGTDRIVVQLPGVQDTARAKDTLGKTATLEFRLVDQTNDAFAAAESGRAPLGSRLYRERSGQPILLQRQVIVTGDAITDASSGIDQQSGSPAVFVNLDGAGANRMDAITKDNIGKLMAVVFIEYETTTREVDGEMVPESKVTEEVINVATIRDRLSRRFQISGLDSTEEARDLALFLRAGALAAPLSIIEERTVGPSAGRENIRQGFNSAMIAFIAIMIFMAVYYRVFGLISDLALAANLVLLVGVLSMLQATLTLPGIAGIVLTLGMAVDANVLIFERIREEVENGNSPQAAIRAGFDKAFGTIADANITTLIAAIVLFGFGSGPIKGFAVTLSIGILTSMFTAIMMSRGLVSLAYGGRSVRKLAI